MIRESTPIGAVKAIDFQLAASIHNAADSSVTTERAARIRRKASSQILQSIPRGLCGC